MEYEKEMTFDVNEWHSKFYRRSYCVSQDELPQDFCTYFWKLAWAILLLPITWSSYPVKRFNEGMSGRFAMGFMVNMFAFMCFLAGQAVMKTHFNKIVMFWWQVPLWILVGLSSVLLILGAMAGIVSLGFFIVECHKRRKKSIERGHKQPSLVTSAIKSHKEKYCPMMTWKDEENEKLKARLKERRAILEKGGFHEE